LKKKIIQVEKENDILNIESRAMSDAAMIIKALSAGSFRDNNTNDLRECSDSMVSKLEKSYSGMMKVD
jgi:hypothetical protein